MKIMIAVDQPSLDSKISDRFARTAYFLIYDLQDQKYQFINNDIETKHGAGPKAVQLAIDNKVSAIISAIPGENAMDAIKESKIKVYDGRGFSAKEAIEKFENGEFEEI
jgi:predicted Fe-Mo cluster-binding NifX family protein